MTDKISKIDIETNDPSLVVDINKQKPTYTFVLVGLLIVLAEAAYLLYLL